MSLIKCPECGRDVSNKAKSCPNCGFYIKYNQQEKQRGKFNPKYILITAPIAIMLIVLFIGLDDKYGWIKKKANNDEVGQEYYNGDWLDRVNSDLTDKPTERPSMMIEDKSAYTDKITYEMLARTPEQYINSRVKFTGTVTQIVTVKDYGYSGFRMAVDNDSNQNLLVVYETDIIDFNLLENDNVTIYAGYIGPFSYESTLGGTITVPEVCAVMIDLNDNALVSVCSLQLPTLPVSVSYKNWEGVKETTISIEDIKYEFEKNYDGTYYLNLTFAGTKTYEKENLINVFNFASYKLYDEEDYIVDSGSIVFSDINAGEKFKGNTITIYNLSAGNYRLELLDYK